MAYSEQLYITQLVWEWKQGHNVSMSEPRKTFEKDFCFLLSVVFKSCFLSDSQYKVVCALLMICEQLVFMHA